MNGDLKARNMERAERVMLKRPRDGRRNASVHDWPEWKREIANELDAACAEAVAAEHARLEPTMTGAIRRAHRVGMAAATKKSDAAPMNSEERAVDFYERSFDSLSGAATVQALTEAFDAAGAEATSKRDHEIAALTREVERLHGLLDAAWTPVADGLPPFEVYVDVTVANYKEVIMVRRLDVCGCGRPDCRECASPFYAFDGDEEELIEHVIAWRPRPEPWRGSAAVQKTRAIDAVAARLMALLDVAWFMESRAFIDDAVTAACIERDRLRAIPDERWSDKATT